MSTVRQCRVCKWFAGCLEAPNTEIGNLTDDHTPDPLSAQTPAYEAYAVSPAAIAMVMDHVSDGVFILKKCAAGWRFKQANPVFRRLLGRRIVGQGPRDVMPEAIWRQMAVHFQRMVKGGQPLSFQLQADFGQGEHHLKIKLLPVSIEGQLDSVVGIVRVNTQSVRMHAENRNLKNRFAASFEYAPHAVAFMDSNCTLLQANRALCKLLGQPVSRFRQTSLRQIVHPDDSAALVQALAKVFEGKRTYDGLELRFIDSHGQTRWVSLSLSSPRVDDEHGHPYVIAQAVDISVRKQNEVELLRLATQDHLTGVHNRLVFERALNRALTAANRYSRTGAVLFIDLDEFKAVNDTFGHKAGDTVLRQVATLVRDILREGDLLARLGGDEFVAILEQVDEQQAHRKADEIRTAIENLRLPVGERLMQVGASVGVKVFDGHNTAEMILGDADMAMYREKMRSKRLAS